MLRLQHGANAPIPLRFRSVVTVWLCPATRYKLFVQHIGCFTRRIKLIYRVITSHKNHLHCITTTKLFYGLAKALMSSLPIFVSAVRVPLDLIVSTTIMLPILCYTEVASHLVC